MRLFDPDSFLNVCATGYQAIEVAKLADRLMSQASFVLYGRYSNGKWQDLSSDQKPGDTHCLLAYAPKALTRKN